MIHQPNKDRTTTPPKGTLIDGRVFKGSKIVIKISDVIIDVISEIDYK